MYTFHVEFLRKSFLEFGSFPFWNPYYGAGFPVWENPSSKLGSFTHLFALFFTGLTALKLSFIFYFVLSGILNFHSFRLYNKSSHLTSIIFVCMFQFSGYFFQKFYAGHMNQIQGFLLPAFVFYFLSLLTNPNKWIFCLTLTIAYILLSEGAIYPITQIAFLLICLSIREIFISEQKEDSIQRLIVMIFLILFILSFKWVPMFLFVHKVGRYFVPDNFSLSLSDLYPIFFGPSQHPLLSQSLTKMQYRYWEYGNYIGQLPLYASPLLLFSKRKSYFVLGLLLVLIWMMLGKTALFSPASLIEHIPVYSSERVYPRWSLSVVFLFTWCLVEGYQTVFDLVKEKFKIYFSILTLVFLSLHTLDVRKKNTKYLDEIFVLQPQTRIQENKESYPITVQTLPDYRSDSRMVLAIRNNLSTNDIYENLTFYFTNLPFDSQEYHGEFYLYPSFEKVKPIQWKPDQFTFGPLPQSKLLVFNQKFHSGFVTNVKNAIPCSWNGYLAVPIKSETQTLVVEYSILNSYKFYNPSDPSTICPKSF